jgi:glycosyltransferase involved in cell wall biosynthesis
VRLLFVALGESVHTMRWTSQLDGTGWDIHLFLADHWLGPHRGLRNITLHNTAYRQVEGLDESVRYGDRSWPLLKDNWPMYHPSWNDQAWRLARTIRKLQPDIIHSLALQPASYLTWDVKREYDGRFPTWVVTNWGSDIYVFGRLAEHRTKVRGVLESCDYYMCECHRDVKLGHDFGLRGKALPILPNTGGFDLERIRQFRQPGPTSSRRLILLKGYQGWAGRALVGLRAVEMCADILGGYRIVVYLAGEDVKLAAELLSYATSIPVDCIPRVPHDEMLRLHGSARISIGLSIGDAISTSLLEAMAMGSFPIQSHTSCGDEWIRCGESGILVHPEDPAEVARAIRCAIEDDALIDRAAEINERTVRERLDGAVIREQVIATYERVSAGA